VEKAPVNMSVMPIAAKLVAPKNFAFFMVPLPCWFNELNRNTPDELGRTAG
jgi:hypothetical protein